ncbi:MAG: TonB-dependent receptor, partial [Pseudomonadota bacterium]
MSIRNAVLLGFAVMCQAAHTKAQVPVPEMEALTIWGNARRGDAAPGFSRQALTGDDLLANPALTLDDILRRAGGFSLFRRTSSRVANPTIQGPSLRNFAPNGAGRALVLRDGVPQNDPFGGWVYWGALPGAQFGRVGLLPGQGAADYGNGALTGAILLDTRGTAERGAFRLAGGTLDSADGFGMLSIDLGPHSAPRRTSLSVTGFGITSDGHLLVSPEIAGPADVTASLDSFGANATLAHKLPTGIEASFHIAGYHEERTNGFDLAPNSTRLIDASLTLTSDRDVSLPWRL